MDKKYYDEELNASRDALVGINYAEKSLKTLRNDIQVLKKKKQAAEEILAKENKDVEKITGVSFQSFVATLLRNRDEQIEKEELEAIEAKRVYDELAYEYENMAGEILQLEQIVIQKQACQLAYNEASSKKKQFISSQNPELWMRIEGLETNLMDVEGEIKELQEAIDASVHVINKTEHALSELQDAKNLGVWDMVGGGLLVTMAKREHMAKAQGLIKDLNSSLNRFSKELKDVNMSMSTQIDIGSYLNFADYFFDGLFVDMMVQNKIHAALDNVRGLHRNVCHLQSHLKKQKGIKNQEKLNVIEKIDDMILNA